MIRTWESVAHRTILIKAFDAALQNLSHTLPGPTACQAGSGKWIGVAKVLCEPSRSRFIFVLVSLAPTWWCYHRHTLAKHAPWSLDNDCQSCPSRILRALCEQIVLKQPLKLGHGWANTPHRTKDVTATIHVVIWYNCVKKIWLLLSTTRREDFETQKGLFGILTS